MKPQLPSIDPFLSNLIRPEFVTILQKSDRQAVLEEMGALLLDNDPFCDKELLLACLAQREELVSTGIGMGIAIPHARIDIDQFYLSIGISLAREGVVWPSLDQLPVRLVVMIVGPKERPMDFLKLLSSLTSVLKSELFRERLFGVKGSLQLYEEFTSLTPIVPHDKNYTK